MTKAQGRVFDPATFYAAFPASERPGGVTSIMPLQSFTWSGPTGCWRFTAGVPSEFGDLGEVRKMRELGLIAESAGAS